MCNDVKHNFSYALNNFKVFVTDAATMQAAEAPASFTSVNFLMLP